MDMFILAIKVLRLLAFLLKQAGPFLREAFLGKDTLLRSFKRRPDIWIMTLSVLILFAMLMVVARHAADMTSLVAKGQETLARTTSEFKKSTEYFNTRQVELLAEIDKLKKEKPKCEPQIVNVPSRRHKHKTVIVVHVPTKPVSSTKPSADDRSLLYNLDQLRSKQTNHREQP